jgi:hypothetical protein
MACADVNRRIRPHRRGSADTGRRYRKSSTGDIGFPD